MSENDKFLLKCFILIIVLTLIGVVIVFAVSSPDISGVVYKKTDSEEGIENARVYLKTATGKYFEDMLILRTSAEMKFWVKKTDQNGSFYFDSEEYTGRVEELTAIANGFYPSTANSRGEIELSPIPEEVTPIRKGKIKISKKKKEIFYDLNQNTISSKENADVKFILKNGRKLTMIPLQNGKVQPYIRPESQDKPYSYFPFFHSTEKLPNSGYNSSIRVFDYIQSKPEYGYAFILKFPEENRYAKLSIFTIGTEGTYYTLEFKYMINNSRIIAPPMSIEKYEESLEWKIHRIK